MITRNDLLNFIAEREECDRRTAGKILADIVNEKFIRLAHQDVALLIHLIEETGDTWNEDTQQYDDFHIDNLSYQEKMTYNKLKQIDAAQTSTYMARQPKEITYMTHQPKEITE